MEPKLSTRGPNATSAFRPELANFGPLVPDFGAACVFQALRRLDGHPSSPTPGFSTRTPTAGTKKIIIPKKPGGRALRVCSCESVENQVRYQSGRSTEEGLTLSGWCWESPSAVVARNLPTSYFARRFSADWASFVCRAIGAPWANFSRRAFALRRAGMLPGLPTARLTCNLSAVTGEFDTSWSKMFSTRRALFKVRFAFEQLPQSRFG